MQEVGGKGNEHRDATQYFKLDAYTCMPPSFQKHIYTLYYWRDTFCDVFELTLESVCFFQKELDCFMDVTICL